MANLQCRYLILHCPRWTWPILRVLVKVLMWITSEIPLMMRHFCALWKSPPLPFAAKCHSRQCKRFSLANCRVTCASFKQIQLILRWFTSLPIRPGMQKRIENALKRIDSIFKIDKSKARFESGIEPHKVSKLKFIIFEMHRFDSQCVNFFVCIPSIWLALASNWI